MLGVGTFAFAYLSIIAIVSSFSLRKITLNYGCDRLLLVLFSTSSTRICVFLEVRLIEMRSKPVGLC